MENKYVGFDVYETYLSTQFTISNIGRKTDLIRSQDGRTVQFSLDTMDDDGKYHLGRIEIDPENNQTFTIYTLDKEESGEIVASGNQIAFPPVVEGDQSGKVALQGRRPVKNLGNLIVGYGPVVFSHEVRVRR